TRAPDTKRNNHERHEKHEKEARSEEYLRREEGCSVTVNIDSLFRVFRVFRGFLLLAFVVGCARNDSLPPADLSGMALIPAGSFTMGDREGGATEAPHRVTVRAFYLDKVPVTQELYEKVMGVNPSKRKDPKNPVERTQWTDAVRFCNKCSELEGLTPCYDLTTWECNFDAEGYRLPTEAEWECACRAGSTGKY